MSNKAAFDMRPRRSGRSLGSATAREILAIRGAVHGAGLTKDVLLLTHGRFSSGTTDLRISHIAPAASDKGPVVIVHDDDLIRVDIAAQTLDLLVDPAELRARRANWAPLPPRHAPGLYAKQATLVQSAPSYGAITG